MLIITSNNMPSSIWPDEPVLQFSICRRFKFITLMGTYPLYEPIDLSNLCESNFL